MAAAASACCSTALMGWDGDEGGSGGDRGIDRCSSVWSLPVCLANYGLHS